MQCILTVCVYLTAVLFVFILTAVLFVFIWQLYCLCLFDSSTVCVYFDSCTVCFYLTAVRFVFNLTAVLFAFIWQLSQLMNGEHADQVEDFHIIDCRYPYEFEGGHIEVSLAST